MLDEVPEPTAADLAKATALSSHHIQDDAWVYDSKSDDRRERTPAVFGAGRWQRAAWRTQAERGPSVGPRPFEHAGRQWGCAIH